MSRHVSRACARLVTAPTGPDRRTSLADCRIALCLARGIPVEDIDPARGYDLSTAAYRSVRARWLEEAAAAPDSGWLRARYTEAREIWGRWRPDLIADWPEWDEAVAAARTGGVS